MSKNGIQHKDVPEHRLINPLKTAKENQPKNELAMWTWIKKNALKPLLPFVQEVTDVFVEANIEKGEARVYIQVSVLSRIVFRKTIRSKI